MFDLNFRLKLEVLIKVESEVKITLGGTVEVPTLTMDELNETAPPYSFEFCCEEIYWSSVFESAATGCWPKLQKKLKLLVKHAKKHASIGMPSADREEPLGELSSPGEASEEPRPADQSCDTAYSFKVLNCLLFQ